VPLHILVGLGDFFFTFVDLRLEFFDPVYPGFFLALQLGPVHFLGIQREVNVRDFFIESLTPALNECFQVSALGLAAFQGSDLVPVFFNVVFLGF
jgi:hypothetical protein